MRRWCLAHAKRGPRVWWRVDRQHKHIAKGGLDGEAEIVQDVRSSMKLLMIADCVSDVNGSYDCSIIRDAARRLRRSGRRPTDKDSPRAWCW